MEEERPHDDEMIATSMGYMTHKELCAPEIPVDEDYKNERTNELFGIEPDEKIGEKRTGLSKRLMKKLFKGFKPNPHKKDRNRDMDR